MPKPPTFAEAAAQVCHEVNRAICEAAGDHSQVPWQDAAEWQRASSIKGVEFVLQNPDVAPELLHDAWAADKIADGWKFGPVKDAAFKTHPCLVPYSALPLEQHVKDHAFRAVVQALRAVVFYSETA